MNIQRELAKLGIEPNISKDQFFLADEKIVKRLVDCAGVNKSDRVLEVGPGLGLITRELAEKAKEVIAIEIDERFKPILSKLPNNVEVVYGNAYRLLNDRGFRSKTNPPTKTVSSIPYSQAQNMLHNYTNSYWYQGDLFWIAPASFANKINKEPILGAYFTARIVEIIPKSAFYPQPNTSSAIIFFKRIANPKKTKNFQIYMRRWFYNHEEWKLKNALREGIIKAERSMRNIRVTKNEARNMILRLGLPKKELEKKVADMRIKYYFEIPRKLERIRFGKF